MFTMQYCSEVGLFRKNVLYSSNELIVVFRVISKMKVKILEDELTGKVENVGYILIFFYLFNKGLIHVQDDKCYLGIKSSFSKSFQ